MADIEFHQFSVRDDNFCVLVHDPDNNITISIDAPEENAIRAALSENGWQLTHILITHHHFDHVAGIDGLKKEFDCSIIGPAAEAGKIAALDERVSDGDRFKIGNINIEVIATPGHTLGEISFHLPNEKVVFTGDTLFALGCGRVFEGTPEMMWHSLAKLAVLPRDTKVYCGHEYTLANARFAVTVDPENEALHNRLEIIEQLRNSNLPTLPTTIGLEMETNPFLRPSDPAIRKHLAMEKADDAAVFAEIRARKDSF